MHKFLCIYQQVILTFVFMTISLALAMCLIYVTVRYDCSLAKGVNTEICLIRDIQTCSDITEYFMRTYQVRNGLTSHLRTYKLT
jgi:hypothetical protein